MSDEEDEVKIDGGRRKYSGPTAQDLHERLKASKSRSFSMDDSAVRQKDKNSLLRSKDIDPTANLQKCTSAEAIMPSQKLKRLGRFRLSPSCQFYTSDTIAREGLVLEWTRQVKSSIATDEEQESLSTIARRVDRAISDPPTFPCLVCGMHVEDPHRPMCDMCGPPPYHKVVNRK